MDITRREKLKRLISKLPLGAQLLQLRRKVKAKKAISEEKRLSNKDYYYSRSVKILEIFQRYSRVPLEQATAFEIGSGRFLIAPIGLSLLGFGKVITIDIRRAVPDYVQTVYKFYGKHKKRFGICRVPKITEKFTEDNLDEILLRNFNVDYRAPYDAAHTDLPDNSVDFVFSQATFEYISVKVLQNIVKEAYRVLHGGGVAYIAIPYKDNRATDNPELNIYDYLKYTSDEWLQFYYNETYSSRYVHQNRLRTKDYQSIFTAAGFEVIEYKSWTLTDADRAAFATVKVADEFKKKYTDEELMETGGQFILRKP